MGLDLQTAIICSCLAVTRHGRQKVELLPSVLSWLRHVVRVLGCNSPVDVVGVDAGEGRHLGDLLRGPVVRVDVGVGVLRYDVAVKLDQQEDEIERER